MSLNSLEESVSVHSVEGGGQAGGEGGQHRGGHLGPQQHLGREGNQDHYNQPNGE